MKSYILIVVFQFFSLFYQNELFHTGKFDLSIKSSEQVLLFKNMTLYTDDIEISIIDPWIDLSDPPLLGHTIPVIP